MLLRFQRYCYFQRYYYAAVLACMGSMIVSSGADPTARSNSAYHSQMQAYLSPETGKPIPAQHPDRVEQITPPVTAFIRNTHEPLPNQIHRSTRTGGGLFQFAGSQQRAFMRSTRTKSGYETLCAEATSTSNESRTVVSRTASIHGH